MTPHRCPSARPRIPINFDNPLTKNDTNHGYLKYMDMNEKVKAYIRGPNWIISQRQRVYFYVLLVMDESDVSKTLAIKEDR